MNNPFKPLFQSIFPIIYSDENNMINIAGTSILAEYKNHHFLLTAAHVLKDPGSRYQLHILLKDKTVHLNQPASMNKLQNESVQPDIDIGFFSLDCYPSLLKSLNGYDTITLKEFDEDIEYDREYYFVFGYPWRRAKYNRNDNELNIKPLQYFTDLITDDLLYSKYNRPKESHILVKYNPKSTKNSDRKKQLAPYPHGISGGPLFKVLVDKNDYMILIILEGLLIEWKESKVIVSTKKSKIREFIDGR